MWSNSRPLTWGWLSNRNPWFFVGHSFSVGSPCSANPIRKGCDQFKGLAHVIKMSISKLVGGLNPSEKYESQLGLLFPIYGKIKNVPNHQPDSVWTFRKAHLDTWWIIIFRGHVERNKLHWHTCGLLRQKPSKPQRYEATKNGDFHGGSPQRVGLQWKLQLKLMI